MKAHLLIAVRFLVALGAERVIAAEPVSIFGVPLRSKLSIPSCPYGGWSTRKSGPCVSRAKPVNVGGAAFVDTRINFPFGELPLWVSGSSFHAYLVDGHVERIWVITTGAEGQPAALRELTEKFGKPSQQTTTQVQNRYGAIFGALDAYWQIPDLSIRLWGVVEGTGKGSVAIASEKGTQAYGAWSAGKQKRQPL